MAILDGLESGTLIDSYLVEAEVARSATSTVYRATDTRTGRVVALKVPQPDMEADPVLFERFQREAAIGEKFSHAGIMHVFGGENRSRAYMVMEWCEGRTLRAVLGEGRLPQARAIAIAAAMLDALEHIHEHGVVHRNLTPENVMVDGDGVKLIDFGIAGDAGARRITYTRITSALGTPDYISPEQVRGKRGDARSDIFAVGVILYEMLTGKTPFTGATAMEAMNDRLLHYPVPPRVADPSITPELQEVIYRALERDPMNRYGGAGEFAHELRHLDEVGVENRPELQTWRKRERKLPQRIALYALLALIPVAILVLMALLSGR